MSIAKIYVLKHPVNGEIRYVGRTIQNLNERLRRHINDKSICHRTNWILSLKNQELKPLIEEIQSVENDKSGEIERFWMDHFTKIGCKLTNGTEGAEMGCYYKRSEITKEKIRQATIKQFKDPKAREAVSKVHKGKTISDRNKKAVGLAAKKRWENFRALGLKMSDEFCNKLSKSCIGRKISKETKLKISKKLKGIKKSPSHRANLADHLRKVTINRVMKHKYNSFCYEI